MLTNSQIFVPTIFCSFQYAADRSRRKRIDQKVKLEEEHERLKSTFENEHKYHETLKTKSSELDQEIEVLRQKLERLKTLRTLKQNSIKSKKR